jgi:DNA-directed RNA polymerase specialized sigma24 family protein
MGDSKQGSDRDHTGVFLTTQWTRVLAAQGKTAEAREALSDLCAAYYAPVVAFLRAGRDEDLARELAHEFFARLLDRHQLDGAHPQRGRFRSYLLGAVKHFLMNRRVSALREKRGAGARHEPIGAATDTSPGLEIPDPAALPPDAVFDREWAVNVLDRSLKLLACECEKAGALRQFETLKPWLTGDRADVTQAEAARTLRMTEGAVRVAIHRLRRRFRELVKSEISQTVEQPGEVDSELSHLIAVLT